VTPPECVWRRGGYRRSHGSPIERARAQAAIPSRFWAGATKLQVLQGCCGVELPARIVNGHGRIALGESRRSENPQQAGSPEYLAIPGLLQKYYLRFQSGEYGGVYVWDSTASMERYMASELARSICHVYRVEESVRDVADVVLALPAPGDRRLGGEFVYERGLLGAPADRPVHAPMTSCH
jgi:hypothetical protein